MEGSGDRRKRIRRLKKIIVGTIVAAIVIPVMTSIILGVRVMYLQGKVSDLETALMQLQSEGDRESGIYTTALIETSPRDETEPSLLMEDGEEKEAPQAWDKQIYLTFDDGPSRNTDRILDILKEYDIKATFFVVGKTDEASVAAYQRIVEEGHTLAMHSYSHKYAEVYASKESFVQDLKALQEYLYQVTGVWPRYYRFPGGSSNTVSKVDMQELIGYLEENNITYFDWNIASGDAVSGELPVDSIVNNCVSKLDGKNICMILMHDAADKNSTVEALPQIIEQIRDRGDAVFLPVTDDTLPVQHVRANK
ncbi:MAG: polysaccharide deacetylase family protein [Bacillota bacterium]|nr:polysaccharide deacetylase family protein [Bacillota bacterium]